MNRTTACMTLIISFATIGFANFAQAQNGEFENMILGDNGGVSQPYVRFEQTTGTSNWIVTEDSNMRFYVKNGYKFYIYDDALSNSLVLDATGLSVIGDVNADRFVLDSGTGNENKFLSMTHSTTGQSFGVSSLDSINGLYDGGVGFSTDSAVYPLWVFDTAVSETLALREEGVGIGTYDAIAPLHVYADGFPFAEAKVVVENNLSGTPQIRDMFELVNNGGSRFTFTDTSLGSKWFFASNSAGKFTVSLAGTGGSEFSIGDTGRVIMGPGGAKNLDVRPNGNVHILGTLFQSSDRNLKTAFTDIDPNEVLDKVAQMPFSTWQFKFDEPELRHIGPMSQDFHAAFKLSSDDKTIAPIDGIGVSLVAIKALKQQVDSKNQQVVELKSQMKTQTELLAEQGELLHELSIRLEQLESTTRN